MQANKSIGVVMNESNWTDVVSNMGSFPFRASDIKNIHKELQLKKISFKYAVRGEEIYSHAGKTVKIETGQYLLSTNNTNCEVLIRPHEQSDLGLCIDMDEEHLSQAFQMVFKPESFSDQETITGYFFEDSFFEKFNSNKYFDQYLRELYLKIQSNDFFSLDELSLDFTRQFLFHHLDYMRTFKNIPAIKSVTKKELYEKMICAKNKLHESVYSDVAVKDISKEIYMSHFRFFHLFKDTFGISPHKYLLDLKLNEALRLHNTGKYSWTEIASQLCFADVQSFSKLFKKTFRINPSEYTRQMNFRIYRVAERL